MSTITNADRAEAGQRAMEFFGSISQNEGEPDREILSDLLADLMHYCRQEGIDFNAALHTAQNNYEAETNQ